MTTYVARITEEGEIESVWTTGIVPSPPEGTDPDDSTKTIVYIAGDNIDDIGSYREGKYYKDGHFVDKADKPGEYYNWKDEAWVLDSVALWVEIRLERDKRLYLCDWTQVADAGLSAEIKQAWVDYRLALRGVPAHDSEATHINGVSWPTAP